MIMSQINIQKFRKFGVLGGNPQMRSAKKNKAHHGCKKSYSWMKKAS